MFGATAVRQKRERERRERLARASEPLIYPYIPPFPARFQAEEIPYFKYRKALEESGLLGTGQDDSDTEAPTEPRRKGTATGSFRQQGFITGVRVGNLEVC